MTTAEGPVTITPDAPVDVHSALATDTQVVKKPELPRRFAAAEKLVHPPSAIPNFVGLPTQDARSQVLLNFRGMRIIQQPRVYKYVPGSEDQVVPVTPTEWSGKVAFLIPNGLNVAAITFIYNNTVGYWMQDLANVFYNENYDFGKGWADDGQVHRVIYKSTTIAPNMTAFNDTGTVAASQFNPGPLQEAAQGLKNNGLIVGSLEELTWSHPRIANALLELHAIPKYDAPEDIVEGPEYIDIAKNENYAENTITLFLKTQHLKKKEYTNIWMPRDLVKGFIQILWLGRTGSNNTPVGPGVTDYVPSQSQVMQNSVKSYAEKAREGAFVVNRLNTLEPPWIPNSTATYDDSAQGGLLLCYVGNMLGNSFHLVPLGANQPPGPYNINRPLLDTRWSSS